MENGEAGERESRKEKKERKSSSAAAISSVGLLKKKKKKSKTPGLCRRPHQRQLRPVAAPAQPEHPEGLRRRQDRGRRRPLRRGARPGGRARTRQPGAQQRRRRREGLPGRALQGLHPVELRVRAGLREGRAALRVALPVRALPGHGGGPGTLIIFCLKEKEEFRSRVGKKTHFFPRLSILKTTTKNEKTDLEGRRPAASQKRLRFHQGRECRPRLRRPQLGPRVLPQEQGRQRQ